MTVIYAAIAAACALPPAGTAASARPATARVDALDAGTRVERPLVRGEIHAYPLILAAGEFAAIEIEQEDVDVIARVEDPRGIVVEEVQEDILPAGVERVPIVAAVTGTYTLRVRPGDGGSCGGVYAVRLVSRRPAVASDTVTQQIHSARTEAAALEAQGAFDDALTRFERALHLAEAQRPRDDLAVARIVFDLAGNALERRDDVRSRTLYERAAADFDTLLGPGDPYAAMARSRLALLDERAGENQRAESTLRQSLAVLERTLGPDHPWYLKSLVTLSNLRSDASDLQEAEALQRRVLAVLERTGQTDTLLHATVLNNLADILRQRGDFGGAQPLFERSLAIGERLRGPDSYFVSTALQNLGIVARERKDYRAALAFYERALAIRERVVGGDHPDVAQLLNNIANVYHASGDDRRAIDVHLRALDIWRRTADPYARGALISTGNLARTYAALGEIGPALRFEAQTDTILERQIELYVEAGSERQKLAFVSGVAERTDRTISLHLDLAPDNADAAGLAALVVLQRKGRVQDAMADVFAAARTRAAGEEERRLFDELREVTAELARRALGPAGRSARPVDAESIGRLAARKEEIESALSGRSALFRSAAQAVTVAAVQRALPAEAVLLEFIQFRPFDPRAERNAEAFGPPHYAAYVLRQEGAPWGVDLGTVADIDRDIAALRDALRDPRRNDVEARSRALNARVMQPLRAHVGAATRLLVSPDGDLNLVPFEALADYGGRFLIERYSISYLTSGRDLLRLDTPRATPGPPVIVADPAFGSSADAGSRQGPRARAGDVRRSSAESGGLPLYFPPLSGSASEGKAIKMLFPRATLLVGGRASKTAVSGVKAPSILHIASHGFFLGAAASGPGAPTANPLLRSGLAFAGANVAAANRSDGLLTAMEAAGLDLWGTRLVTLSACDTGVGEVRSGEGVFGLRRAFVLAGAETLVMSLWPVSDTIARDTMVAYYEQLRAGGGRGDALRAAKLAILNDGSRRHPYYWAGFIQFGLWTPLDTIG